MMEVAIFIMLVLVFGLQVIILSSINLFHKCFHRVVELLSPSLTLHHTGEEDTSKMN